MKEDKELLNEEEICREPPGIVLKIFVSYLQVTAISKLITIDWPTAVTKLLSITSQINVSSGASSASPLDCSLLGEYNSDRCMNLRAQGSPLTSQLPS